MRNWLRLCFRSLVAFVWAALRPLREFRRWADPLLGVAVYTVIDRLRERDYEWSQIGFYGLILFLVLLLIEGLRREYAQRVVMFKWTGLPAEYLANGKWKFSVVVRNLGAKGEYIAHCRGRIDGLANYVAECDFRWEGSWKDRVEIRRPWERSIVVGVWDAEAESFGVTLPESEYSGAGRVSIAHHNPSSDTIRFLLEVRHTQSEASDFANVEIFITESPPRLAVTRCAAPPKLKANA